MAVLSLNSNLLSLNAQRRLGEATSSVSQSYNRLSSGLRITKASDDAAGLAISENLKTDSRLSTQAIKNVNDGVSMISIISGALGAQKDILYRMSELAEQSANGVLGATQRTALQGEYKALLDEFDRVASTAKFNGISLLRNQDPTTIKLMAGISGVEESLLTVTAANSHQYAGVLAQRTDWDANDNINIADQFIETSYNAFPITGAFQSNNALSRGHEPAVINAIAANGDKVKVTVLLSRTNGSFGGAGTPLVESPTRQYRAFARLESSLETTSANGVSYTEGVDNLDITFSFATAGTSASISLDLSGLTYQSKDPLNVNLTTVTGDAETRQTAIGFTHLLNAESSKRALDTVKNRIQDLSALEGEYGAIEARLLVAGNQLSVNRENFTTASSQITDADIATESANLLKNQILQQAATSVLGQANQQPAMALRFLNEI